jgi:hypothetical protein
MGARSTTSGAVFIFGRHFITLCADTFVTLYFGWQSTIALVQTGTTDTMVLFPGSAFGALSFRLSRA